MPGRNDPCPCRSGKKYKHCCLPRQSQPIDLTLVREERAAESLLNGLGRFCLSQEAEVAYAMLRYFGPDLAEAGMPETMSGPFLDWYAFAYRDTKTCRTMLDLYLERQARRLSGDEKALGQRWLAVVPGVYTLVEQTGAELQVEHLLTGERCRVLHAEQESDLEPGALLAARLLPVGSAHIFGLNHRWFRGSLAAPLRRLLDWGRRFMALQHPGCTMDDLLRERWPLLDDLLFLAACLSHAGEVTELSLPGVPARPEDEAPLDPAWQQVETLLDQTMERLGEPRYERERMRMLWRDAARRLPPGQAAPAGWAAGAACAFLSMVRQEAVTQSELAQEFGLSASTLNKRFHAIRHALDLRDLDPRYADPLDPAVRARARAWVLSALGERYREGYVPTLQTETALRRLNQVRDHAYHGEWDQAAAALERVDPGRLPEDGELVYHMTRIHLLMETGRLREARAALQEARERFPDAEELGAMKARLLAQVTMDQYKDAVDARRAEVQARWLAQPIDPRAPLADLLARRNADALKAAARHLAYPDLARLRKADLVRQLADRIPRDLAAICGRLRRADRTILAWVLEQGGTVPLPEALARQEGPAPGWETAGEDRTPLDRLYLSCLVFSGTGTVRAGAPAGPILTVPAALRAPLAAILRTR